MKNFSNPPPSKRWTYPKRKKREMGQRPSLLPSGWHEPLPENLHDPQGVLQDGICLLRRMMQRIDTLADEKRSLTELLRVLDTLGKNYVRISMLLKAQRELSEAHGAVDAFQQALADVIRELEQS